MVFTNPFNQWLMAGIVPCVLAIIATPLVIYLLDPPGVKDTPEAPIEVTLTKTGPQFLTPRSHCTRPTRSHQPTPDTSRPSRLRLLAGRPSRRCVRPPTSVDI